MKRFDWRSLMKAGLQGLRLSPSEFWGLSPAELQVLLGHGASASPMGRDGLDRLLKAFPDDQGEETGCNKDHETGRSNCHDNQGVIHE